MLIATAANKKSGAVITIPISATVTSVTRFANHHHNGTGRLIDCS